MTIGDVPNLTWTCVATISVLTSVFTSTIVHWALINIEANVFINAQLIPSQTTAVVATSSITTDLITTRNPFTTLVNILQKMPIIYPYVKFQLLTITGSICCIVESKSRDTITIIWSNSVQANVLAIISPKFTLINIYKVLMKEKLQTKTLPWQTMPFELSTNPAIQSQW